MRKKEIIYIHGDLGAGKTSTADLVAKKLGYRRLSAGHFFKEEAEARGMTLVELNEYIQNDRSVDRRVDERQKESIEGGGRVVLDGRIGFYLAPDAIFNVFLEIDPATAARRVLADKNPNLSRRSETATSAEDMERDLIKRAELERAKLMALYGIADCFDKKHFDLVVDTRTHGLGEVSEIIITAYKKWLAE